MVAVIIGDGATTAEESVAIGTQANAAGPVSVAIGYAANTAGDGASVAIGLGAQALNQSGIGIGQSANAVGNYAVAVGDGATVTGFASSAIGVSAHAENDGYLGFLAAKFVGGDKSQFGFGSLGGQSSGTAPFRLTARNNNVEYPAKSLAMTGPGVWSVSGKLRGFSVVAGEPVDSVLMKLEGVLFQIGTDGVLRMIGDGTFLTICGTSAGHDTNASISADDIMKNVNVTVVPPTEADWFWAFWPEVIEGGVV